MFFFLPSVLLGLEDDDIPSAWLLLFCGSYILPGSPIWLN